MGIFGELVGSLLTLSLFGLCCWLLGLLQRRPAVDEFLEHFDLCEGCPGCDRFRCVLQLPPDRVRRLMPLKSASSGRAEPQGCAHE